MAVSPSKSGVIRQPFHLLTVLSLALCVAASVSWVRSYFVGEQWTLHPGRMTGTTIAPWGETETWRLQNSFRSGAGRLQLIRMERQTDRLEPAGHTVRPSPPSVADYRGGVTRSDRWSNTLGFGYLSRDKQYYVNPQVRGSYWGIRVVTVPYWCLVVATAALPAFWLAAYARRRTQLLRSARLQCQACGYDLRASPGRCPECGTVRGPDGAFK